MKRVIYSGITKTILAFLLLFCCIATAHYGFLTLRAPVLYGSSDTVYETRQYSELFSKYVERTAVYVRYRESGYELSDSEVASELALLLNGEATNSDLEGALFNVYEPSETAFYYYYSKLNEEPTNYRYYVKNTKTNAVYASADFNDYAIQKSGSVDQFLASGITKENLYLIINTENSRTMTGGGNPQVLNRSNLLWSMDFLHRPLSDMAKDVQYDYNYHVSDETVTSDEAQHLDSVSDTNPNDLVSPPTGDASSDDSYLLYAFIADHTVEDEFFEQANTFYSAKEDFKNGVQTTVIFTLLSVFLFTICHVVSGRKGNTESIHLHFYDRIYTELILLALAVLLCVPHLLWEHVGQPYWGTSLDRFIAAYPKYRQWAIVFLGGLTLFLFLSGILYFSLIRRIKAKLFLKSSFLGRFILLPLKKLFDYIGKSLQEFYRALPSLGKTILYLSGGILWLTLSVLLFLTENFAFGLIAIIVGALLCALLCLRNMLDRARITQITAQMSAGNLSARIPTTSMLPSNKNLSEDINQICDGLHFAVEEQTKSERMKTELITNVSHDIKTPLTSIINYIELIKNELPQEGAVAEYAEILSQKSWRLKALIDDLVEASKAASGTMKLEPIRFNAVELLRQAIGDFEERLTEQNLTLCVNVPETPVNVLADGACTHRIIENMLSNVCKYALSGTRVFVSLDLPENTNLALLTVKNTSASILSKTPEELLTRFARGNDDRSGEGSGLGLSIAESLATLQGGSFQIEIDGDLFKAKLAIPLAE